MLARVLGVKPNYFLSEPELMVKWLAFRKQTRLSKGRQEQVKAYAEGVVERAVLAPGDPLPAADGFVSQAREGQGSGGRRGSIPATPQGVATG